MPEPTKRQSGVCRVCRLPLSAGCGCVMGSDERFQAAAERGLSQSGASPRLFRQYRAAAWDTNDGTRDTGLATPNRELAEKELVEILNAEPPYDRSCIQTRLVSDWECCDA